MTNGRSIILVVGLQERVVLDGLLGDKHAEGSKHGNTSVLKLSLTVALDFLVIGIVGSSVSRARISAHYSACDQRSYADVVRHVWWNVNHTTSTQEAD